MNVWLVDASVLLASEDADDDNHSAAQRLLEGADPLATLDLAFYEVVNVAIAAWKDQAAAQRLCDRITLISGDGGLARADQSLLEVAAEIAFTNSVSVYDAAYAAAAGVVGAQLVSCDIRDLVSRALAQTPAQALTPAPGAPGADHTGHNQP